MDISLFPVEYIPLLLTTILHESVYNYAYVIREYGLATMVAFGRFHPEILLNCFTSLLPEEATVACVTELLSEETDEERRSHLFDEFRMCLCSRT
jgi:hypothetical protein